MNAPLTVLMPVYNSGKYLAEAVESVLDQSFKDFEFLIINDGSTDGSLGILKEYAKKDKRIKIINQENKGLIQSLNKGLEIAQGEYIARMDADDVALPERLTRQYTFLKKNPDHVVVGGSFISIDSSGKRLGQHHCFINNLTIRHALPLEGCIPHPTAMYLKTVARKAGAYRQEYFPAEDYDLWRRLSNLGKLHNIEVPVLLYRHSPGSISASRSRMQKKITGKIRSEVWASNPADVKVSLSKLVKLSEENLDSLINLQRRFAVRSLLNGRLSLFGFFMADLVKFRLKNNERK